MAIKTGTAGADTLVGTGGDDTLNGLGGDDQLTGGKGPDLLVGGAGKDTARYDNSSSAITVNLLFNTASSGDATGDRFREIENVTGSKFADQIIANALDNVLRGNAGNDTLFGLAGDDVLVGGAGSDKLEGDSGNDTVDYGGSGESVVVNLLSGVGEGGDAQGDTYDTIESATGSQFHDILVGSDANNVLRGGGGPDTLLGVGGNDTLVGGIDADLLNGGEGFDAVDYSGSAEGVLVHLDAVFQFGGDAQGDTLKSIESLAGSAKGDGLFGDAKDNFLRGLGGDDTLDGGLGNDTIFGDAGDDRISGGGGADHLEGGNGSDTVSYLGSTTGVVINLNLDTVSGDIALADTIKDFENASGSDAKDSLIGNAADNRLDALNGNDELLGLGGSDTLIGDVGADKLAGGSQGDVFLYDDTLDSGVGAGKRDVITDFSHAEGDRIDLHVIDATAATNGDSAFSFIGTKAFSAPGQVRFFVEGDHTVVEMNTFGSGDTIADGPAKSQIELAGNITLVASDFIL